MGILIRLAISAVAVWITTWLFDGISLGEAPVGKKALAVIAVAVIFGVVNAVLRPVIKVLGCWAYVLTLGIVSFFVNGALLMLTSWIAGQLSLPFHVDEFWPTAVLGALVIGVISWVLNLVVPDGDD